MRRVLSAFVNVLAGLFMSSTQGRYPPPARKMTIWCLLSGTKPEYLENGHGEEFLI